MSAQTLGSIFNSAPKKAGITKLGKKETVTEIIDDFQSDTAAIEARRDPLLARATLYMLVLLIILVLIWASTSFLDRVVAAPGRLVSTAASIVIQPIETAIVKTIEVKPGDVVKKGQILATLDSTFTQADVAQVQSRVDALDAQITRLKAEQEDRPLTFNSDTLNDYQRLQLALWNERQALYQAQFRGFDEKVARAQAGLDKVGRDRDHFKDRLTVLKEIETMRNSLAAAQVGSRLNSLLATDSRIEIERNLTLSSNEITALQHELQSLQADRTAFVQQWQGRIVEDLVARSNEREGLVEQLVKAKRRKDLVRLEAPDDAVVLEIADRSVGAVVREAEALVKLVPLNSPLEIEADLDASDIGNIKVGDPVQIKLAAYSFLEHGMMKGEVLTISEDAFTSKDGRSVQNPYYRVRITIGSTDTLYDMPSTFRLIPGMPLVAEIRIGERSVMSYFLRPIMRGMKEGLREP